MDLARPIEALIPGAQGRLLGALVCAGQELNTRTAAEIASVSAAHASRVLAELVTLGVVRRRDVPPVVLYQLVDDSAVGRLLVELCNLRGRVFAEMTAAALEMSPGPVRIVVFGSVARCDSGPESDIDVLIVAPAGADPDSWETSVSAWRKRVERFAGSRVELLEINEHEWRDCPPDNRLWREIDRDGIVVFGGRST